MDIQTLRELIRTVTIQDSLVGLVVKGLTREQLCEIVLLAQSRLLELENKRVRDNPLNPS